MLADTWIRCQGRATPTHQTTSGRCGQKIARLLSDGRFELKFGLNHGNLALYVCSGVTLVHCPMCSSPCVLICAVEGAA